MEALDEAEDEGGGVRREGERREVDREADGEREESRVGGVSGGERDDIAFGDEEMRVGAMDALVREKDEDVFKEDATKELDAAEGKGEGSLNRGTTKLEADEKAAGRGVWDKASVEVALKSDKEEEAGGEKVEEGDIQLLTEAGLGWRTGPSCSSGVTEDGERDWIGDEEAEGTGGSARDALAEERNGKSSEGRDMVGAEADAKRE